jgi:antitoxin (DNA-binding transcriptional repressor) of toxin-antitoxin stability system
LFSDLLRRVRAGEQIVIAHAGTPIAKLVPFAGTSVRHPGVIRAHLVIDRRPTDPGWSPPPGRY